jgi:hypothetical protein
MMEGISKQNFLQVKPGFGWEVQVHGESAVLEAVCLKFAEPAGVGCMKHPVRSNNAAGA